MHELSIAANIADIAHEYAQKANAKQIKEVDIEIGSISGIVIEALRFALDSVINDSALLKDAKFNIISIPGKMKCTQCSFEFETDEPFAVCPKCHSIKNSVIQGNEMRVKSIAV